MDAGHIIGHNYLVKQKIEQLEERVKAWEKNMQRATKLKSVKPFVSAYNAYHATLEEIEKYKGMII